MDIINRIAHNALKATVNEWTNTDLSYADPKVKNAAHNHAKILLKVLATEALDLREGQFEVRSNKGGIAVSGEVTLMTDSIDGGFGIMVQIGQWSVGKGMILYRAVDNMKDYRGYRNQWISMTEAFATAEAVEKFGKTIKALVSNRNQSRY